MTSITARDTIFVAHPFTEPIMEPLREAIGEGDRARERFGGLDVLYADRVQRDGTLSCKVCQAIRSATVTLFDLIRRALRTGVVSARMQGPIPT